LLERFGRASQLLPLRLAPPFDRGQEFAYGFDDLLWLAQLVMQHGGVKDRPGIRLDLA
jgi:hypothetical protein